MSFQVPWGFPFHVNTVILQRIITEWWQPGTSHTVKNWKNNSQVLTDCKDYYYTFSFPRHVVVSLKLLAAISLIIFRFYQTLWVCIVVFIKVFFYTEYTKQTQFVKNGKHATTKNRNILVAKLLFSQTNEE